MGKSTRKFSEMAIYSPKISPEDYRRIFDELTRKKIPLFESIDLSRAFSFQGFMLVIQRHNNTIKIFVEDRDGMYAQSSLLFPFRLGKPDNIDFIRASGRSFGAKFVGAENFFNFLIKENVVQIRVKVMKLFGAYVGFGSYINERGQSAPLYLSDPTKFLEIDLENNPLFYIELLDPIPKTIYFNSNAPIFTSEGANMGVDNFDVLQHGLIVGTSGCGKSKFISILVQAIRMSKPGVRIVLIDPHGEFSKLLKKEKIINFQENYIEPFDVGKNKSPLIAQLVAQLITSTIGQESRYAERVVFYSVHMLASMEMLTMENINLLLTDSSKRAEFTSMCDNDEVKRFFDREFQDIYMHHFNDAILPVTNFIGEYSLYLGQKRKLEDLAQTIKNNRITVVSFNPNFFSRNIIKFFAGSIINQLYLMAISEKLTDKTILIVDEFPTVETKVAKDLLAETRKFNLNLYVSAQYLGQLSKPVLDGLMSNVRNIIAFRVTKEDAKLLSSMMEIKVEEFFKKHVSPSELEESKKEMFVKLHTQECIVRLFDGAKYMLPMKLRTVDAAQWEKYI